MPDSSKVPAKGEISIDGNEKVREIVTLYPIAADVMSAYGIHCVGCSLGGEESLREGCALHQMSAEQTQQLVDDINEAIATTPVRPQELQITKEAAQSIASIADSQGHTGEVLRVVVDERGGFCMEFAAQPEDSELPFSHIDVPEVVVCASAATLSRIGGSTIDFRDGRFKLDVDGDSPCGCTPSTCGCTEHEGKTC